VFHDGQKTAGELSDCQMFAFFTIIGKILNICMRASKMVYHNEGQCLFINADTALTV